MQSFGDRVVMCMPIIYGFTRGIKLLCDHNNVYD